MTNYDLEAYKAVLPVWAAGRKRIVTALSPDQAQIKFLTSLFGSAPAVLTEKDWDVNQPAPCRFDLLFLANVLFYVRDPAAALNNMRQAASTVWLQDVTRRRRTAGSEHGTDGDRWRFTWHRCTHACSRDAHVFDLSSFCPFMEYTHFYDGGPVAAADAKDSIHFLAEIRGAAQPWLPGKAVDFLSEIIRPDFKVFEYGSGGSTLFFADRAAEVISVDNVSAFKLIGLPAHCKQFIIGAEKTEIPYNISDYNHYASSLAPGVEFKGYVSVIDRFPAEYFDLILIDGRARPACIRHVVENNKLKRGGWLVIDNTDVVTHPNFERAHYKPAMDKFLSTWEVKHIRDGWTCSFWRCQNDSV